MRAGFQPSGLASPLAPQTLFEVLLAGCACLVAVGVVMHWLPPRVHYPRPREDAD